MPRCRGACHGEAAEQYQPNAAGGDAGFHCGESALNELPVVLSTAGCSWQCCTATLTSVRHADYLRCTSLLSQQNPVLETGGPTDRWSLLTPLGRGNQSSKLTNAGSCTCPASTSLCHRPRPTCNIPTYLSSICMSITWHCQAAD